MIIVEDYEAIRRAYYIEKKSIRQIAREQHHSRTTIRKAIEPGSSPQGDQHACRDGFMQPTYPDRPASSMPANARRATSMSNWAFMLNGR